MSFLDLFRRKDLTASPDVVSALRGGSWSPGPALGGSNVQAIIERWSQAQSASYGYMYRTQPAVRKVVHKIAENLSQMSPKLYERIDETERKSAYDHPASLSLRYPNGATPADRYIYDFTADFLVYDNAYSLVARRGPGEPVFLFRWPVHLVVAVGNGVIVTGYRLWNLDGSYKDYTTDEIMHWSGYNPDDPRLGVSPLETLRQILAEDAAATAASTELAKSGLKGGHLERPLEAPVLDAEGAEHVVESWAKASKASPRLTPLLEEGMKFVNDAISPKDAELLDGRRFTTEEVADVYGVPRGMFSEHVTEEDRNAFYSDVLAPLSKKLASQLDHSIVQGVYGETDYCFQFDMNEKLRGSPEKRWPAMTAAAGAPWLLRDEVREEEGLPPLPNGEGKDLIVPLNVLEEGPGSPSLPAPNVMPPQDPTKPPQDGSYRENPKALNGQKALMAPRRHADFTRQRRYIDEAVATMERFYRRQLKVLQSPAKAAKGFDSNRWNRELSDDLKTLLTSIVEREGGTYVGRLAGNDFDMRQVQHYLEAQAEGMAKKFNEVTQRNFEGDYTAREALDRAIGERSAIAGASIGARATVFARQEAAKQSPGTQYRQQTWIADTDRHSDLDGTSVPLGSDWGGIVPGSEPNCACSMEVS